MKVSDYLFTYSWSDLRPIRELRDAWVTSYLLFGVAGLFFVKSDSFAVAFIVPAALGCYPAFLIGTWWQGKQRREALADNTLMVKQLRFLSLILSVAGASILGGFLS